MDSEIDLFGLQKQLAQAFDLEEIKQLCLELGIDYENIAGDTKLAKTRELVKYCYRDGRIPDLLSKCVELRPKFSWDLKERYYGQRDLPDDWAEPLQRLYALVKAFNRNRQLPYTAVRTVQGDEIAFAMREAAPFLFNQFDVGAWLSAGSPGKRLAAIKYLDWLQDIDYLEKLLAKLATEHRFIQFHVLLAVDGLLDQLGDKDRALVKAALTAYRITRPDATLEHWRARILDRLQGG